ncbi:hypothetical protein Hanom_Chr12g01110311 [Helianthus anomalus]
MILNGIYNSFFLFYMWNLSYFQSITYFLYFFSLCTLFLKKPTLRLGSGRGRCASPAPGVFDNIE